MSAPPPIKKLKQTTLSFHTTNSVETLVILETKLCDYKLLNYIELAPFSSFDEIFYTIPVAIATAEMTFSALRRLKTYLRATMSRP